MNEYTAIPDIITRLKSIPQLNDAVICEDFTSPSVSRPVLKTMISVGINEVSMLPVSRGSHTLSCVMRLSLFFPCGLGDAAISDTAYRVAAAFAGRIFHSFLVKRVTTENAKFNASLYGVLLEMFLHMECVQNVVDPLSVDETAFKLKDLSFDRFPDKVTEERNKKDKDTPLSSSPRVFTLIGSSSNPVGGMLWKGIRALMGNSENFPLSLPRSSEQVSVLPLSCSLTGDTCGYSFDYTLVFEEVL